MNRIDQLFQQKPNNVLTLFTTAGYPNLNDTLPTLEAFQTHGADIVEIGIPFSDPLADGPTIQQSSEVALKNGMSLKLLFEQIKDMRKTVHLPVLLMGYFNPVMRFGIEEFCKKCAEVGIDGLILPDLPYEQYEEEFKATFEKYGLANVLLITPQTSDERIRKIDESATGFIYMVSSASTTGARSGGISDQQRAYFERIQNMNLKTPRLIGFGISDKASFDSASANANGAIIASAYLNLLAKNPTKIDETTKNFIAGVRG